jgi:hypothetical protein
MSPPCAAPSHGDRSHHIMIQRNAPRPASDHLSAKYPQRTGLTQREAFVSSVASHAIVAQCSRLSGRAS